MQKIDCNHCEDTVVLADRGERIVNGETPLEHMKRTGHSPKSPKTRQCNACGNVWPYTGDADRPTCPNCRGKDTEETHVDA